MYRAPSSIFRLEVHALGIFHYYYYCLKGCTQQQQQQQQQQKWLATATKQQLSNI